MANTGTEIVLTLAQVESPCPPPYTGCTPAPGSPTKPNIPSDPDYVAPFQNLTNCPVVYNTDCPIVVCTGDILSIIYEFGLPPAVVENPAIDRVRIKAMLLGVEQGGDTTIFAGNPTPNYFSGTIAGLAASTTYTIEIDYLLGVSVIDNCPSLDTITTV